MRKVMTFLKEAAIVVKEQPGVCFAILVLGFALLWELCIAGSVCKLKITLLIFSLCAEKELLQKEIVRRRSKTAHVANMAVKTGK